ncbi:DUF4318 domain-containing protein [Lysinibacillus piscis]|uniref:DUF4318 domain-containing protein n=1 Tax=Lysinibacillus piscis TaxID=2518931 RepID=A0ABQ5NLL2_9BACI|nr:DUF4318 domain-containing protein [Lysinibacillus sp. KH24]GLC89246.1 hypothetical protein LYSBPC_23730 [Lysinibacillus sp. KH24]
MRFFKKLRNKGFLIELHEALTYPSAKVICEAVEKHVTDKEFLLFESTEKPVTFYLDDVLYRVEIKLAYGGYILHCKEA